MNKIIAAIVLVFVLLISVFLFIPSKKKNDNKKVDKTKIEENTNKLVFLTKKEKKKNNTGNKTTRNKKARSSGGPRHDAASHGMEDKFFVSFNINDFETMSNNLEEKLVSINNARAKSKRASKK